MIIEIVSVCREHFLHILAHFQQNSVRRLRKARVRVNRKQLSLVLRGQLAQEDRVGFALTDHELEWLGIVVFGEAGEMRRFKVGDHVVQMG